MLGSRIRRRRILEGFANNQLIFQPCMGKIEAKIWKLEVKLAEDIYTDSPHERYETYKKQHPGTKKLPSDPSFKATKYKAKGEQIGKTKSGKPIMDTFKHPAHKGMTREDHVDASNLHGKLSLQYERQMNKAKSPKQQAVLKGKAEHHRDQSTDHWSKYLDHEFRGKKKPKEIEMI